MIVLLKEIFKTAGFGILITVIIFVIWLSPLGRLIDEFAEFREWKRNKRK
jgi:hypothetical protein